MIMLGDIRSIALLMAREIDEQNAPEDEEYISEWVPEHRHDPSYGGPDCAACWMYDFDARLAPTIRQAKAEGWDEGWDRRGQYEASNFYDVATRGLCDNPYRVAAGGDHDDE